MRAWRRARGRARRRPDSITGSDHRVRHTYPSARIVLEVATGRIRVADRLRTVQTTYEVARAARGTYRPRRSGRYACGYGDQRHDTLARDGRPTRAPLIRAPPAAP